MHRFILIAALAACLSCPALAQQAAPAQQAVPVGTIVAAKQPVSKSVDFTGRVAAINKVDIRARVSGYLESVEFTEGDTVKEGDKLFQIDDASFKAAVQQAEGALLQAQGTLTNATLQRQRADDLVRTSAMSVAQRDQRVADEQNAKGALVQAQANLETAKVNLGYTTISSPIEGRVGRALVTKGNLVGPDSGSLTSIVSQDPMYVLFPVSQREFLRIHQEGKENKRDTVLVQLRFADGSPYDHTGEINFVDVSVDPSTDTVLVRASVPNPDRMLVDNQFVRIAVVGKTPEEQVVIPQAALLADQEGTYVFVV
ncbi:MAG: efflux RND transporter periplasmic adaptor subunit, partial [Alphaproteobacteria bacterium]|nr:efflux RND transporter periplasmic adaptor subunit [Alphaproteobacteria bacterium]